MFRKFQRDRSGNFAVITALMMLPMALIVGFAIDGTRYYAARSNLQDAADMTALALAASEEQDVGKLRTEGEKFVLANVATNTVEGVKIKDFSADENQINMSMTGQMQTTFMRLANYETMSVSAFTQAMRAPIRKVEVALVLDNTYSMKEEAGGVSKMDTLKTASNDLIETLLSSDDGNTKIGVVPYAEYVNVGLDNRGATWLNVGEDHVDKSDPEPCYDRTVTTQGKCTAYGPYYEKCTTTDGVRECSQTRDCTKREPSTTKTENYCPPIKTTTYKWYGCVGSRMPTDTRLHDRDPMTRFPGYVETSKKCLSPIVPLTTEKKVLQAAINGMVYISGSYKPLTYIPAGLIWGQNLLSPQNMLAKTESARAEDYDADNVAPRKIMILMTDGDNTMVFRSSDGRHVSSSNVTKTNNDSKSICDYSKSKRIEIYTVAFMVDNDIAKKLLEDCATDKSHYFNATNSAQLVSAFNGIAKSINQVRLAQ